MDYTILLEKNNSLLIRNKKGKYQKIPKNKFFDGEFVQTTKDYFSPKELTSLTSPIWSDMRGWVYTETYCKVDGDYISIRGGCGSFFDENNFLPLENETLKIMAEICYRKEEKYKIEMRLKTIDRELDHLKFTQKTLVKGVE